MQELDQNVMVRYSYDSHILLTYVTAAFYFEKNISLGDTSWTDCKECCREWDLVAHF